MRLGDRLAEEAKPSNDWPNESACVKRPGRQYRKARPSDSEQRSVPPNFEVVHP